MPRAKSTRRSRPASNRENHSLVAYVILAGLERYKGSEFGFAEYKAAVEEAGEDQTGRLYRKTEVLGLIGSIAPMLGLTGTVLGMIKAFNTIAASGGMARPDELAGGHRPGAGHHADGIGRGHPDDDRLQLLPQPHRFDRGRSRQTSRADHDAPGTAGEVRLSKSQAPTSTRVDMNMTPMIDIVFLLIIFFMTVSQVSESIRERLELPKLTGAEDQKRTSLTINVDQQGQIIVSGNAITTGELLAYRVPRVGGRRRRPQSSDMS